MEEVSEVYPDLPAANIIVRIAAGIKTDQFKALAEIESDGIGIAGLGFQDDGAPFLAEGDFLCLVHQFLSDALSPERFTHP